MTCKDCVHYEPCRDTYYNNEEQTRIPFGFLEKDGVDKDCGFFKDRSKFIDLPCKVGQMVYRICPVPKGKGCSSCPWEYCYCYDIGYQKDRPNTIREVKVRDFEWVIKRKPYFGKVYFSTCEEAEQALKEREKE
jgi:hypothetical protein